MAQSLPEWLAQDLKTDSPGADGLENQQQFIFGLQRVSSKNSNVPRASQQLSRSRWSYNSEVCFRSILWSVAMVKSWPFWTILLAVAALAWDPLRVRQMLGLARSYQHFKCQTRTGPCCPPAPDVDGWPEDSESRLLASEFFHDTGIPGPETLAWDLEGRGPYTGLADGRVFRWSEGTQGFEYFGHASPYWTEDVCAYSNRDAPSSRLSLEHTCGRPLGLKFHPITGELFIVDAYFGLAKVGPLGGKAELLIDQSLGVAHTFSNDLDIDEDGIVYLTVSSTRRSRRECNLVVMERESTGRVLAYDPKKRVTSVILKDLHYPNGIAVSKDSTFLLVASTSTNSLLRFWLRGPLTGVVEKFAQLPGYPDNIQSTDNGEFWLALHGRRTKFHVWLCNNGWASRILFSLYNTYSSVMRIFTEQVTPVAMKYDAEGRVLDILEDRTKTSHTQFLSSAVERDGKVWLGSIYSSTISFYNLDTERCNVSSEK